MKILRLNVADLHQDPANLKKHGLANLDAIKASLARFGQQTPIVVDEHNVVRKGNGTLLAAANLGWTKIDAVRTGLTGSEATGYSIADNRSADLGTWDSTALATTLQALQDEGFNILDVGFSDGELTELIDSLGSDLIARGEDPDAASITPPSTRPLCPTCGRDSSGRRPT